MSAAKQMPAAWSVGRSAPSIRFQWEEITPERARTLLNDHNPQNRTIRKMWVSRLADAHRSGRFVETHQGIAIGPDLQVFDGQHRLSMVADSGVSAWMWVAYYLTRESADAARLVIDQGAKRAMGDAIEIVHQISNGRDRVATSRAAMRIDEGNVTPSEFAVCEHVLDYRAAYDAVRRSFSSARYPAHSAAAFVWAHDVAPDRIDALCARIDARAGLTRAEAMLSSLATERVPGGTADRLFHATKLLRGIELCLWADDADIPSRIGGVERVVIVARYNARRAVISGAARGGAR